MADDDNRDDDFQEMLRRLFASQGTPLDPEALKALGGLQIDPAMMAQVFQQMQSAMSSNGEISWDLARTQARQLSAEGGLSVTDGERTPLDEAFRLASLWLGEVVAVSELAEPGRLITRTQWVDASMPVWEELAEPVASSIADALTATIAEQAPEEMRPMLQGAGRMMRAVGGSLFATQLGRVVGGLSKEVLSGGDVGLPLLPAGEAAILPQNIAEFASANEIDGEQLGLYLATREIAHARLFRHAKWLRLHVLSQIGDFARGIHVDTGALESLAERFDPANPEELRSALESGALLPEASESQTAALGRLETLMAIIEGWVDVVTEDATARLPHSPAIAEAIRRRRATGGPAEQALGSLVGLEMRPRRLREAALMWRRVTDAVGIEARDALWDYPDFLPSAEDIDEPGALIARILDRGDDDGAPRDEIDDAIARILAGEEPGDAPSGTDGAGGPSSGDDASGDEGPEGPKPV